MIAALTLVFATLPATALLPWTFLGVVFGIPALFEGIPFILPWALAGLYGTVALWFVTFRSIGNGVAAGLAFGIAAFLPLTFMGLDDGLDALSRGLEPEDLVMIVAAVSVPLVAAGWLVYCLRRLASDRRVRA